MIININKPKNYTSFDVVAIVRKTLRQKRQTKRVRVGHAGTLDPLATGVLIVLTDQDTKNQDKIMHQEKEYNAKIAFGAESETYDLEAPLNFSSSTFVQEFKQNVNDGAIEGVNKNLGQLKNKLLQILPNYIGEIEQTVPPYSAVKVTGKPLYKTSRNGKTNLNTLPVKRIYIKDVKIEDFTRSPQLNLPVLTCTITCGSGAYIRSLAHDIGKDLGLGGVLVELTRTKVGDFKLEDSLDLADLDSVLI